MPSAPATVPSINPIQRDVQRMLKFASSCVVFSSYLALFSTYRYDISILIIPVFVIGIMPIAERLDRTSRSYRALTTALTFCFVVCLPLLLSVISLLDAVTGLVIYIQVYSMLHVKQQRNYLHILLMSFFLLLAASVLSPSPMIGLVLLLFVVSTAWMLILLEMLAGAEHMRSGDSAEIEHLYAYQTGSPRNVSRLLDVRMTGWILVSSAGVIALTALLFFSSPRLEAGLFGASDSDMTMTALSHDINITGGGPILQDPTAVMHVRFPEEEDGQFRADMLWRNSSLNFYTGTGWSRRALAGRPTPGFESTEFQKFSSRLAWDGTDGGAFRGAFGFGREVVQEIFLAQRPEEGVPALQLVRSIGPSAEQSDVTFRWDSAHDFTINSSMRGEKPLQYRVHSEVYEPTAAQLRGASSDYRRILDPRDFELLTGHNLLPETMALVAELTVGQETVYDTVIALQRYLRGPDFLYSLNVPELPGDHPIDAFILTTRTGHCQLFATALALMARAEGIPTRVVSGYRGGAWSGSDRSYTVTANLAHLWVEVYFPEYGWIPFDPSPPSAEFEALSISAIRRAMSRAALIGKMAWYQNVIGFTPQQRMTLLKDVAGGILGIRSPESGQESTAEVNLLGRFVRLFPALVLLMVIVFFGYAALRRMRRPVGPVLTFTLTEDQKRAVRLRRALCDRLELNGIECNGRTVAELRAAIGQEPWAHSEGALSVLASYNAVRFGARPLPRSLFTQVRRFIAGLRPVSS